MVSELFLEEGKTPCPSESTSGANLSQAALGVSPDSWEGSLGLTSTLGKRSQASPTNHSRSPDAIFRDKPHAHTRFTHTFTHPYRMLRLAQTDRHSHKLMHSHSYTLPHIHPPTHTTSHHRVTHSHTFVNSYTLRHIHRHTPRLPPSHITHSFHIVTLTLLDSHICNPQMHTNSHTHRSIHTHTQYIHSHRPHTHNQLTCIHRLTHSHSQTYTPSCQHTHAHSLTSTLSHIHSPSLTH